VDGGMTGSITRRHTWFLIVLICFTSLSSVDPAFSNDFNSNSKPSTASDSGEGGGFSTRIVGGSSISISQAPWQVALIDLQKANNYQGQFCGGSLISAQWVLTAAHCVVSSSNGSLVPVSRLGIQVGSATLSINQLSALSVERIVVHPSYRSNSYNHDIALVKLSSPVQLRTGSVEAIPLVRGPVPHNSPGFVTGWGQTGMTTSSGYVFSSRFPTVLEGVGVYVADSGCWGEAPSGFVSSIMLCAGSYGWNEDTCQGDSGGPLAVSLAGTNYLAGVTSWGYGCAWLSPGVYTKVSNYVQWIDQNSVVDFSSASTPTISGFAVVGQTLTANPGSWDPDPDFSYQWLSSNRVISGATGSTYLVKSSDLRKSITVRVTATKAGYAATPAVSAATSVVTATMPFGTSSTPTITGSTIVGQTLTVDTGSWDPSPSFTYQWLSNNRAIRSATNPTYTAQAADLGKQISVRVVAKLSGYTTATLTSNQTAAITPGIPFDSTATPTISGFAVVGQTLTANPGSWDPDPDFSYQWLSSNRVISGATGSTYLVKSSDLRKSITVRVTATKAGYAATPAVSAATSVVTATMPFGTSSTPTITGSTIVGQTLTVDTGSWDPSPSFTYQWLSNNRAIRSATNPTYTAQAADLGKQISVRVVAKLSGYTTATLTSNQTAAITPGIP
jgi:secreted trypsin-like serine protease